MKWGPTSAIVLRHGSCLSALQKEKNVCARRFPAAIYKKTLTAPITAIIAWDSEFYERLPLLFPHGDARSWFTSSPQLAEETAFRNSCRPGGLSDRRLPCAGTGYPHYQLTVDAFDDAFFAGSTLKSDIA